MTSPIQIKVGDKLTWLRQGDALHCIVLEVSAHDGRRAKLQSETWLGTRWEYIDYSFSHGFQKVKKGILVPIED